MSPRTTAAGRRRVGKAPAYARRARREVLEAAAAVVAILAATGLRIWAMRPGGIAGRQPRAILLGLITLAVLALAGWLLAAPGRRFDARRPLALALAAAIALAVAVVGALAWPDGIIVDEPTPPTRVPDPITDTGPPIEVPTTAPASETTQPPPGP